MDEIITWANIGKLIVAGISVYVIQPLLLVARDAVLWTAIDKWILTGDLKERINEFLQLEEEKEDGPKVTGVDMFEDGKGIYTIDGKIVNKEEYDQLRAKWKASARRVAICRNVIDTKRQRLGWLIRHYKQPEVENPIDRMLAEARASRQALRQHIEKAYPSPSS